MVARLVLAIIAISATEGLKSPDSSRRRVLQKVISISPLVVHPSRAIPAPGAAELDMEYYARAMLSGNRKEGAIEPSAPPKLRPPRRLKDPLLSILLSEDSMCVPVIAISELTSIADSDLDSTGSFRSRVLNYRDKAQRSFFARAPWDEASLADQYYFDLTSYAFWRAAADFLPHYSVRDRFARRIGQLIYEICTTKGLIQQPAPMSLNDSVNCVTEVLNLFRASQFCKEYRVGDQVSDLAMNQEVATPVFDEYDDDALRAGATVDCLVSVFEPATLFASLQITGEQSRFAPEFVGTTLAAMWESSGKYKVSWETYFVDNDYRPNPKDYFPNEQLIQFSIAKVR